MRADKLQPEEQPNAVPGMQYLEYVGPCAQVQVGGEGIFPVFPK